MNDRCMILMRDEIKVATEIYRQTRHWEEMENEQNKWRKKVTKIQLNIIMNEINERFTK